MAQLLRRTKKCCAKLLRKLSFGTDSPCSTNSTRRSSCPSTHNKGRSRIAPSPQRTGKIAFGRYIEDGNTPDELSINDDIYDERSINNNNNNNNILRLKNTNISKCFRIHKGLQASSKLNINGNDSSRNDKTKNNTIKDIKSIGSGEEIIFTENRIYIGLTERNLKQYETSSINVHNTATTATTTTTDFNNSSKVKKQTFDALSMEQNEIENLNLTSNGTGKNHRKCSRKLNFDVQRAENSLNTSSSTTENRSNCGSESQVVFEKVKYDKNKKYLQSSPISSGSNTQSSLEQYLNHHRTRSDDCYTSTNWNQLCEDLPDDSWNNNDDIIAVKSRTPWDECSSYTSETIINETTPDPWYFLDNFHHSKKSGLNDSKCKFSKYQTIHYENVSSSRRTSVSTLETWIDDESFDNSFNEELERRCAALVR